MSETPKKRGRPPKVITPTVEDNKLAVAPEAPAESENYSKRPLLSGELDRITITLSQDGRRHIDCGGFTLYDVTQILKNCYIYMATELQKDLKLNGIEEGTPDASSGSDT